MSYRRSGFIATQIRNLIFLLASTSLFADGIVELTPIQSSFKNIGLYLSYLEDPTNSLQLDDIIASDKSWNNSQSEIINFGFTASTYWFRLQLKNTSNNNQNYLLALEYPLLDRVDVYWESTQNNFSHSEFGRSIPYSSRPIKHRNFLQKIEFSAHQKMQIYFKVSTESSMQLPVSIGTAESFIEYDQSILITQGLYFGMIITMFFYNLFLYCSIKDKTYLVYVASIVLIALVQASLKGFTSQIFFIDSPYIIKLHLLATSSLSAVFLGTFSILFLELKSRSKFLYSTSLFFVVTLGILSLISPLMNYSIGIRISVIILMIHALLSFYSGIYIWYRGFKPARYFTAAYLLFFIAVIVLSFNKLGIIERNWITENALEFGSALEIVLLSFALAYRINLFKQDKEQTQRELRDNLEKNVLERTLELNETMDKLSTANERLTRQTIEDSLSGVFNRRHFDKSIESEWQHALRSGTPLTLIMADIDHFKNFNDEHGHAAGDKCLKLVGSVIKSVVTRTSDTVFRYGGEEFAILLPVTNIQGAVNIAENVRAAVHQQRLNLENNLQLTVTLSLGVACLIPSQDSHFEELLRFADQALYAAKNQGRNCVVVHDINPSNPGIA